MWKSRWRKLAERELERLRGITEERDRLLEVTTKLNKQLRTQETIKFDLLETAQIEIKILRQQRMDLVSRLRGMRSAVEGFRDLLMEMDHGETVDIPHTNVDKLRSQMGLPLDGSAVRRPQQW